MRQVWPALFLFASFGGCACDFAPAVGDAGTTDASSAVPPDAGALEDAGGGDAGPGDAGPLDAGDDAGSSDAGGGDAGLTDGGGDAGNGDAGNGDAGNGDAGSEPNCGDAPCAFGDFCTSQLDCLEVAWSNVCENTSLLGVQDGTARDDATTAAMADALAAHCGLTAALVPMTDASYVDQSDGRLLAGAGSTAVLGGGPFFMDARRQLEDARETDVIVGGSGNTVRFLHRTTDTILAEATFDQLDEAHDIFLLELSEEPDLGALVVSGYGMLGPATTAAAWFLENQVLADPTSAERWYVVEWTDQGELGVDGADLFDALYTSADL